MTHPIAVFTDPESMHRWTREHRNTAHERIALVPTMGALHAGHLALVEAATRQAEKVIVSIFVNPTQFAPGEDFETYPRDLEADLAKLRPYGVDVVFAPQSESIYPPGFDTYIEPEHMAERLCGASRPGHFRGVCTVVYLLFRITHADVAVFGEKDYQQLQIIRRMNRDLRLGVEILSVPTVREPDGLALSSRNAYLSTEARADALALNRALDVAAAAYQNGERERDALIELARSELAKATQLEIEYVTLADAETLEPAPQHLTAPAVLALAAQVGPARLIDNRVLGAPTR